MLKSEKQADQAFEDAFEFLFKASGNLVGLRRCLDCGSPPEVIRSMIDEVETNLASMKEQFEDLDIPVLIEAAADAELFEEDN